MTGMITVTVFKKSGACRGFVCEGHAGYAEEGYDIICSAVSALTVNAVNSIEALTGDAVLAKTKDGFLEARIEGRLSDKSRLLLDSMVLGLQEIQKNYGNEYLRLIFKEV